MPLTAQALVEGDAAFTDRLGTPVASGWFVFQEARVVLVATASRGEADERGLHVFFDDDGALVGNGGGRGLPSTASPSSGTRSHLKLVSRARVAGLRTVVAHTLAEDSASTAVLRRCDFTRAREFRDPEDGLVWRWQLDLRTEVTATRVR